MEDIEKYEELDNIVSSLELLIKEIKNEDYIKELQGMLDTYKTEKDELEKELDEQYGEEQNYVEREYWQSQF